VWPGPDAPTDFARTDLAPAATNLSPPARTAVSAPPPQPATTVGTGAPGARRERRRTRLLVGGAVTALAAVVVVAAVLLLGGKSDDGPTPPFYKQFAIARKLTLREYPGTRPIGPSPDVLCDNGNQPEPGAGVPVGKVMTCSFLTNNGNNGTDIHESLHVLDNHPIRFAPITASDCYEGEDQFHKTGPCR
jgi:hypothetical protein